VALQIRRATKRQVRLRVALVGVSGSGKTYTALTIGQIIAKHYATKFGVLDTERGSASKYADLFDFDVAELEDSFSPLAYVEALDDFARAGYGVLAVDGLSHAWMGKEGALEQVDRIARRSTSGSSFNAWRDVTPQHNQLVDALLAYPGHLVVTMRAKTEYVQEKDEQSGRTTIRKIGLAPVQRQGLEYEFDVVGDIDVQHNLSITKTRAPKLADAYLQKPGRGFAETLLEWASVGAPVASQETLTQISIAAADLDRLDPQEKGWPAIVEQLAHRDYGTNLQQLNEEQAAGVLEQLVAYANTKRPQEGADEPAAAAAASPDTASDSPPQAPGEAPESGEQGSFFEQQAAQVVWRARHPERVEA